MTVVFPQDDVDALAKALAPSPGALDAVFNIVEKLSQPLKAETVLVLNPRLKMFAPIKISPSAVALLEAIGYKYRHRSGFYVFQGTLSTTKISMARAALRQAASTDEMYSMSKLMETSLVEAWSNAASARASMKTRPPSLEPSLASGLGGVRITFHIESSSSSSSSSSSQYATLHRRFAPDDVLSDVLHWLVCSNDSKTLEMSHSYELIELAGAPFWWCHGLELQDVTLRPPKLLSVTDAQKNFTVLGNVAISSNSSACAAAYPTTTGQPGGKCRSAAKCHPKGAQRRAETDTIRASGSCNVRLTVQ